MTAVITVAAQLAAGLKAQADRVARYRRRVLERAKSEDIHRLRVALRRPQLGIELARSAIRLPADVGGDTAIATASGLGKIRDSGVARAGLIELQLTAKGPAAAVAERLAARVARRERRQLGRARHTLRRSRVRKLLLGLKRALRRPVTLPFGDQPVELGGPGLVAPLWASVVEHTAWTVSLDATSPRSPEADRSRHQLRIHIKRLRDAVQLLAPNPDDDRDLSDRLNVVATALGDLRDLGKLLDEVEGASPSLTRSIAARLARAANHWESLRLASVNLPSSGLQLPATSGPLSSLRPSHSA